MAIIVLFKVYLQNTVPVEQQSYLSIAEELVGGEFTEYRIVGLFSDLQWSAIYYCTSQPQIIVCGYSELDRVIRALSLELFICMCSKELDFFSCSFSSSSKVHILRRRIWSISYMAFRAGTVLRPAPPGELASIHVERPSEASSCKRKRIYVTVVGMIFTDIKNIKCK